MNKPIFTLIDGLGEFIVDLNRSPFDYDICPYCHKEFCIKPDIISGQSDYNRHVIYTWGDTDHESDSN